MREGQVLRGRVVQVRYLNAHIHMTCMRELHHSCETLKMINVFQETVRESHTH